MLKEMLAKLMKVRSPHATPAYCSDLTVPQEPVKPQTVVQHAIHEVVSEEHRLPCGSYSFLWDEFTRLLSGSEKQSRWGQGLEQERRCWQDFLGYHNGSLNILLRHVWLRYRSKQDVIQLYDSGKIIAECSCDKDMPDFHKTVEAYLRQKVEEFIALSEKEKTKLLFRNCHIKVDFSNRQNSYILHPDFIVLSNNLDFYQINALLLKGGRQYFWQRYLPCQLAVLAGLHGLLPGKGRYDQSFVPHYLELLEQLRYLPFHQLLRKYVKQNPLTSEPSLLFQGYPITVSIQQTPRSQRPPRSRKGRECCLIRWQQRYPYSYPKSDKLPEGELVYNMTNSHIVYMDEPAVK